MSVDHRSQVLPGPCVHQLRQLLGQAGLSTTSIKLKVVLDVCRASSTSSQQSHRLSRRRHALATTEVHQFRTPLADPGEPCRGLIYAARVTPTHRPCKGAGDSSQALRALSYAAA